MGGLFGIALKEDCSTALFYGTDYHAHLASVNAGLAILDGGDVDREIHNITQGQFKAKFGDDIRSMSGNLGIGVLSHEPQPIRMRSSLGEFAICVDGLVTNLEGLIAEELSSGASFGNVRKGIVNQAELIGTIIGKGKTYPSGISSIFDRISGSVSLLILTQEGIYATSDRFPLTVGEKESGFAIASETTSFPNLGFRIRNCLSPKEIVLVSPRGVDTLSSTSSEDRKTCSFLWVYTGFPSSQYYGIGVEQARERNGEIMARGDDVEADFVTGVPDSGIAYGVGYAMGAEIPFRRALQKYTPGWGRSYVPPDQEERANIAHFKIISSPDMIRGKNIVITDDSIVRGTQLKRLLEEKIWPHGPKSVHVRIACPPLTFPCDYNSSTRNTDELVARTVIREIEGGDPTDLSDYLTPGSDKYSRMVEQIRNRIGATSLRYQTIEGVVESIGEPQGNLCLRCWTGEG